MPKAKTSGQSGIYAWVQAACCLVAVGLAIVAHSPRPEQAPPTEPAPAVQAELEVVLIDESVDPLAGQVDPQLPTGVALFTEYIGIWKERRHYARLVLQRDESFEQARARLEPWLATLRLPSGARFGWQRQDNGTYRSCLLTGPAVITARDVQTVEVVSGTDGLFATVLRLHPGATETVGKFAYTYQVDSWAIIVNGLVVAAPRINVVISNGLLPITPSGDDPESTRQSAEALVKELTTSARN